jgi:hypothetical protein
VIVVAGYGDWSVIPATQIPDRSGSPSTPERWRIATRLLCALLTTLFVPIFASAADHLDATSDPLGSAPPSQVDQPQNPPRWTFSTEGIVLERIGGGANRMLVARAPGSVPFLVTAVTPGVPALNSDQFRQGFSAGPKLRLTYRDASSLGFELSYFNVFNQSGADAIGPGNPADWLLMRAPGGFWQTQDFPYQAMAWSNSTNLYSAEANLRFDLSPRLTALAGFRWLQLNDTLQGTLTPTDRTAPTWKTSCPFCNLFQITPDGPIGDLPPFWNGSTTNNLYGVQAGIDANIVRFDRFSLGGRLTFGLFDNNARQSTGVSIQKVVYPAAATANGAAAVSEAGLQLQYQVLNGLSLKAGYEVLWLVGVALAPGQIERTNAAPSDVRALGVNHGSNVLFQGATFGLEYAF